MNPTPKYTDCSECGHSLTLWAKISEQSILSLEGGEDLRLEGIKKGNIKAKCLVCFSDIEIDFYLNQERLLWKL